MALRHSKAWERLWHRSSTGPARWWHENVTDKTIGAFVEQVGDARKPQRVAFRRFVAAHGIRSVADIGGGPAIDGLAFRAEAAPVRYVLIDTTPYFIERARKNKLAAIAGSIEAIPLSDGAVECAYCRHVLLHLRHYEKAIAELVRVSSRWVYVAFSKPLGTKDVIRRTRLNVWSNIWGARRFMDYCRSVPGVASARYADRVLIIEKEPATPVTETQCGCSV